MLLFEVLHEILSLCLVSSEICFTTLSMDSVIVNYLCWKYLFVPEINSGNKSSIILRTFIDSTTQTSKIRTIWCQEWSEELMLSRRMDMENMRKLLEELAKGIKKAKTSQIEMKTWLTEVKTSQAEMKISLRRQRTKKVTYWQSRKYLFTIPVLG